jgi:hypothetical protein
VPISVHPGGAQGVHIDHPAVLADLDSEGIDPHERVRAGIQRAYETR